MPVLMNGKLVRPWQAPEVKAVLIRGHVKFTSERPEAYIAIRNRSLVLKNNIDFSLLIADGFLHRGFYIGNYISDPRGNGIKPLRKNNPRCRSIYLFPLY